MLHTLRTLSFSTRTTLMVLLVLGALLRSGIALAADLHALGHQSHAVQHEHASGVGHEHGHIDESAHSQHEMPPADGKTAEFADAFHGLLHQCSGVHYAALFALCVELTAPVASPSYFSKPDDFSSASLATPFRPPIA